MSSCQSLRHSPQRLTLRFSIDIFSKVTKRVMLRGKLHKRRKRLSAYIGNAIAAWREGTAGFETRHVRWQSRNLIKLPLFSDWIGYRTQQGFCIRVTGHAKQLARWSFFENFARVHHDKVVRHSSDNAEIVR